MKGNISIKVEEQALVEIIQQVLDETVPAMKRKVERVQYDPNDSRFEIITTEKQ
jgi:hypothetical protein